jgi:hypothetical protein
MKTKNLTKYIIISLILGIIFVLSPSINIAYAAPDAEIKLEQKYIREIKRYQKIISNLKCTDFDNLSQAELNKCFIYGMELILYELAYTDLLHEKLVFCTGRNGNNPVFGLWCSTKFTKQQE